MKRFRVQVPMADPFCCVLEIVVRSQRLPKTNIEPVRTEGSEGLNSLSEEIYGRVTELAYVAVLETAFCGFESHLAHHLSRYRLAARTFASHAKNRGSIPRTGTIYALIEYRLVRRSFKAKSRVRFPVGAPICGCDGMVDMNVSKTLFCGSDSHLPHQFPSVDPAERWTLGGVILRSRSVM